jgi:hypothetical protein
VRCYSLATSLPGPRRLGSAGRPNTLAPAGEAVADRGAHHAG